jgi:TolB-like protein/tetratricopeptide (TPR) repeat protein
MSIFRELQRRNVLRVAAGYVAVSWLIVQVMDTLSEAFQFTGEDIRTAVIVLAICFVPVMIVSWAFEFTPEGLKRDADVERDTPAAQKSKKRLDRFVTAALALAVAYFVIDELLIEPQEQPATVEDRSIAVLPFVNMSSDPEQEYFSDGISEELLNLLARIPELRVISRSSAFSYKGKDLNIPDVASELNVAHVLEGSVRKAGNTIRITAQLIHGPTDEHVWSDTWDRELVDIFAIQDEIAGIVVDRLKVELLDEVPRTTPVDPEAYTLYLQADHLMTYGPPDGNYERGLRESVELLERAIRIQPDYVDAMNELSLALYRLWNGKTRARTDDPLYLRLTELQLRALEIDPDNPVATAYQAWGELDALRPVAEAARMFEKAYNMAPADDDVTRNVALFARSVGRLDTAIAIARYVVSRDPKRATAHYQLSQAYRDAGMLDEAEEAGRLARALGMRLDFSIAKTRMYQGDPEPMLAFNENNPGGGWPSLRSQAMALHTAGRFAESDDTLKKLLDASADAPARDIAAVYAWRGEADGAFEWLDRAFAGNQLPLLMALSSQEFDPIRDDPRWDDLLRRLDRHPEQLETIRFDPKIPD